MSFEIEHFCLFEKKQKKLADLNENLRERVNEEVQLNIKKVRRIMRIEQLQSIARKRLKYKMNLDQMHRYSNILNREF